jgi:hypothetical protein
MFKIVARGTHECWKVLRSALAWQASYFAEKKLARCLGIIVTGKSNQRHGRLNTLYDIMDKSCLLPFVVDLSSSLCSFAKALLRLTAAHDSPLPGWRCGGASQQDYRPQC